MTDKTQKPTDARKQKKSETLEVRLPHETKQAFLTACREDGTTASEVVRDSIDTYLESGRPVPQPETGNVLAMIPKPLRRPRLALGAAGAVALAALVALPSAADQDYKSAFSRLDKNKDNVISLDEFMPAHDGDKSDKVVSVITHSSEAKSDTQAPPQTPKVETNEDAYGFWLPTENGGQVMEQNLNLHRTIRIVSKDAGGAAPDIAKLTANFSPENIKKDEFAKYDANGDGKIMLSEFEDRQKAMLTRGFQILDTDSNGSLSQAEYLKITSPPLPQAIAAKGADVKIVTKTSDIPEDTIKGYFAKLDADHNGALSLQEYLPHT